MKKVYLFLLLFSFSIGLAQTTLPDLSTCSDLIVPTVVNLTVKNSEILGTNSPNDFVISFHLSSTDATANLNSIANPTSFPVLTSSTPIFARSTNSLNSTFYIESFNIVVHPNPNANNASLSWCDPIELPIYNLEDAIPQIINGATGLVVTFYETQTDALLEVSPIPPAYVPITTPIQILSARVEDPVTGCFSIVSLTLFTNNCNSGCTAPNQLAATNITDTSVQLNWNTTASINSGYSQIIVHSLTNGQTSTFTAATPSFTLTGLTPDSCYMVYVSTFCILGLEGSWSEPISFCAIDCTNTAQCPEQLVLKAFLDSNANGVKDTGEPNFTHGSFTYQVNSGDVIVANGTNGSHTIFVSDVTNSYNLNYVVNPDYSSYFSTSTSYSNISVAAGSGITTYYFPITSSQSYSDVQVNLIGNNPPPRPGFTYTNTIIYKNNGYQTIPSGTITFTKDAAVTITNISQTGTTATSNGFTYDYANLGPFETRTIQVTMQVPVIPTVNLGDILTNSVTITPNPDTIISNNTSSISQIVVGSYDPNDKMESRGPEIDIDTFTTNDYLYYTIRFENTGTAAAEFIRIEDTLHADLNPATFEMIHASHPYNVTRNGNALVWHFFDIDLPPTIQNPVLSQGYVYFRIKPNTGFAIGDIIPNTAEIYFDYNPAIVTNTFETEFVETLSTTDFNFTTISMYPNPTTSMLNFNSIEIIKEIIVYDLLGNQVLVKNTSDNALSLDVSNLSKGMYLIKFINGENNHTIRKFIKN
jgi:hypothetical protein